jgi:DNA-binding transcriptional ArsR family regulator
MSGDVDISVIGALLADPARSGILLELLGGEPLAASELARRAGVSPSGASNHLRKLLEAGLVEVQVFGRNRLYRLGSAEVAAALEAIGRIAPQTRAQTLRAVEKRRALERARTCYDHLAGRLGVELTSRFVTLRLLREADGSYLLTRRGASWFDEMLGIDSETVRMSRRRFAYACPDLTERQPHLAGALGAAVATAFVERAFVRRLPGNRALRITEHGAAFLGPLGIHV